MAGLDSKENKELILIDGNAIIFRSFYATINQAILKTSKGYYTNALVPFIRMIKKIIKTKHTHLLVLFDTGKPSFRKDLSKDYKANRKEAPKELVEQFQYCRDYLDAAGIMHEERIGYEADDLIGSYAKKYQALGFKVNIFTGDKDLLQLVDKSIDVNIFIQGAKFIDNYNLSNFYEKTNLTPNQYKEMMALSGDPSDNIKGVPGIGDKTSISLLNEFETVEGIYNNIENIAKPKIKNALLSFKEQLMLELKLVAILTNLEIKYKASDLVFSDIIYSDVLKAFYFKFELLNELKEMPNDLFSLINNPTDNNNTEINSLLNEDSLSLYIHSDNDNYHFANIIYLVLSNGKLTSVFDNTKNEIENNFSILNNLFNSNIKLTVYDLKKNIILLNKLGFVIKNKTFDIMLANYLINPDYGDDSISQIAVKNNINTYLNEKDTYNFAISKAVEIYKLTPLIAEQLTTNKLQDIYNNLEYPLVRILANMEQEGIDISTEHLIKLSNDYQNKVENLTKSIYKLAGANFNINSPKQLSDILYNRLGLPNNKKGSTAQDVLDKLKDYPIICDILNYRSANKILTTYLIPYNELKINNKIHTIFIQTITRTGRLSSIAPNMQNIPNYGEGKLIRKIFQAPKGYFYLSLDYSQIELRVLAFLAGDSNLLKQFQTNLDIHTNTAKMLFNKEIISDDERRIAKAVNFGIIYGQSAFGLSAELDIPLYEANNLLKRHQRTFPILHQYLDLVVKKTKEVGYSKTILGRIRKIDFKDNSNANRLALNSPIQGSAADIIKLAMIEVDDYIQKNKLFTKIILQIHDELIFLMPENEREHIAKLKEIMCLNNLEIPLNINLKEGTDLTLDA